MEPDRLQRWEPYWPLMNVSLGVGVIAIPIGGFISFAYAFSGFCGDTETTCPAPEPQSHYVMSLAVVTVLWLAAAALMIHRRKDPIPLWAAVFGLAATTGAFYGLLWMTYALLAGGHRVLTLVVFAAAPFASALLGACSCGAIASLGKPEPDA